MKYQYHKVGSNIVLWIEESNRYLVLEPLAYEVFKCFNENTKKVSETYLADTLNLSGQYIRESYQDYKVLKKQLSAAKLAPHNKTALATIKTWNYCCNYLVYNTRIKLRFSSTYGKELIHPKFAHLLIESEITCTHSFDIIQQSDTLFLVLNDEIVGSWLLEEAHLLQGKFALLLINLCYQKTEPDWMAILHASAVYKSEKAFVFLGESGSGKSTATTLLTMNGYKLLADDFVPLEASNKLIYSFPAAISIKEHLLEMMEVSFPQLKKAELRRKGAQMNYKYLYPKFAEPLSVSLPTRALVFIKYKKGAATNLELIPTCKALELLIPDSWISPLPQNVPSFLEWIQQIPAYRLEYSDNQEFIDVIERL